MDEAPTYQSIAKMSAAFILVASLGYVAYELNQARDSALAEIYQHKTELLMGLNMALAGLIKFEQASRGRTALLWPQGQRVW